MAFVASNRLREHVRVHTGERPNSCSLFSKRFKTHGGLRHHREVHSSRRYGCPYCGKTMKNRRNLREHVCIHTGRKTHCCKHCARSFMYNYQLKKHLLVSHNEGTWYVCYVCEKSFTKRFALKLHVFRHEGFKPYACSECPERFHARASFKVHYQLRHSGQNHLFDCGLCGKSFRCKAYVYNHFRKCRYKKGHNEQDAEQKWIQNLLAGMRMGQNYKPAAAAGGSTDRGHGSTNPLEK